LPADLDRVFVEVQPIDYARILCRLEPMADRHTCMTRVMAHYRAYRDQDVPVTEVVDGPFVAFIDNRLYRGSYVSNPFAAAFTVADGGEVCRGRYNAFAGDTEPVFRVRCDDGREGEAQIVLDQTGRNGLGKLWMGGRSGAIGSAATQAGPIPGDIVFGAAAVGGLDELSAHQASVTFD
jgi:hypothetical protein